MGSRQKGRLEGKDWGGKKTGCLCGMFVCDVPLVKSVAIFHRYQRVLPEELLMGTVCRAAMGKRHDFLERNFSVVWKIEREKKIKD